jgi:hypothetical protein
MPSLATLAVQSLARSLVVLVLLMLYPSPIANPLSIASILQHCMPTFSSTIPLAWDEPPVGDDL